MTVDCPLEINYEHMGCFKFTTEVISLEDTGNPYVDPDDAARGCARAAYFEDKDFFVFKNNGECHAASVTSDYDNAGASSGCRYGLGTAQRMDVYKIIDWECPDNTAYGGFCMMPRVRTPVDRGVCTTLHYCHEVSGTTINPVAICCPKQFCKDHCGEKLVQRDCWCDAQCILFGDCCTEYMDDCSGKDRCKAIGDPHYTSFDNKYFHYQGKCEYTFLSSKCPFEMFPLEIIVKNHDWPRAPSGVTTTKQVRVLVDDLDILLMQGNQLQIGGATVAPPVNPSDTVSITISGIYLLVTTGYGVNIFFDGKHSLLVDVSNAHQGRLCGLCGNFNGDIADDFKMPDGTTIKYDNDYAQMIQFSTPYSQQTGNVNTFGNSWIIPGADCNAGKRSVSEVLPRGTEEEANQLCDELFNTGNIPNCMGAVDPTDHHVSCVMDVMFSLPDITEGCSIIADYVSLCNAAGIHIGDWRLGTQCEIDCPVEGMVYTTCGPLCPATCLDPHPLGSCTEQCIEGCFCGEGLVLDEGGICIEESACGCYYLEALFRLHEVMPNEKTCCCEEDKLCVGERYFEVNTDKVTWSMARDTCEARGGMLAKLNTEMTDTQVRRNIEQNNLGAGISTGFWFGLNDGENEGSFIWSDGTSLNNGDYSNWARRQPNNNMKNSPTGQDCAQLWKKVGYKWDDNNCDNLAGYVCEYSFATACP
uniref:IgGFc-binding protein-like n=1 Tax=Saccoglossus kowalevskii TaxID=10224 RepID=A0ABM0MCJ6_SACKO|nr:PREDICTED: IgGFc-binding protein-like [Saccoglossus kowalevskii]